MEEDGRWALTYLPLYKAVICKVVLGGAFHFVDSSKIHFIKKEEG
jgi:hypothetical protein